MTEAKKEYLEKYNQLDLPIQFSPQWLDAVCLKGTWNVLLSKDNSETINGVLVYHERNILGVRFILMPPFCFYSGPYILAQNKSSLYKNMSVEVDILNNLIAQLPGFSFFYKQLHPSITNWLPFKQHNYNQSTRYTYIIETSKPEEELWSNMKAALKRNINSSNDLLTIEQTESFDDFWSALVSSYKNRNNPYQKELLQRLTKNLKDSSYRLYVSKIKSTGEVIAGALITNDNNTSYYTCGFYNPEHKKYNAMSHLLWHIIKNNKLKTFDFEGSMIPGVEKYFRSFGATQTPHFTLWKFSNRLLKPLIKFKFKNLLPS